MLADTNADIIQSIQLIYYILLFILYQNQNRKSAFINTIFKDKTIILETFIGNLIKLFKNKKTGKMSVKI